MLPEISVRDGKYYLLFSNGEKEVTKEEIDKLINQANNLTAYLEQGIKYTSQRNWRIGDVPKEFDSIVKVDLAFNELAKDIENDYANALNKREYVDSVVVGLKQMLLVANTIIKNPLLKDRRELDEYYKAKIESLLGSWENVKLAPDASDEKQNLDSFKANLETYDFFKLPLVVKLPESKQQNLITSLAENSLPYRIAMLDFLGFINLLQQQLKTKSKVCLELSLWFKTNDRTIKGNINVLSPKTSTETKKRYTAYLYKEQVKKDYQNLK